MQSGTESVAGHPVTDEGKRLSAAVDVARAAGGEGRWIAARLSDGGTDGVIYDSRADAIRCQFHEEQCAYLMVPPAPMPPAEATRWLSLHCDMYAAGYRLQDPDGVTPIMPMQQQVRDLARFAPNRADRRRRNR